MNTVIPRIMSDLDRLTQQFIGFDTIFERFPETLTTKYPPYNIIKEADGAYSIELAVAGFKREEIDVSISSNELLIRGSHEDTRENGEAAADTKYVYRGLSRRSFLRRFALAENVDVSGASLENGILRVTIKKNTPEVPEIRKIEISLPDTSMSVPAAN